MNFTIDYLTRDESNYISGSEVSPSRTPSPNLSNSVSTLDDTSNSSGYESTKDVSEALCLLEKHLKNEEWTGKEKPSHSYIALISMAILSSPEKKMLLSDIYNYIMKNFPYYDNQEKAWRNSVRHNLSLNECFMKNGRADNGKGNHWSVHSACLDDFSKGDFRRRHARRNAKKSMKNVSDAVLMQFPFSPGYVPMTSSPIGYHHPYQPAMRYTRSPFARVPVSVSTQIFPAPMYPSHIFLGSPYARASPVPVPISPLIHSSGMLQYNGSPIDLSNVSSPRMFDGFA